MIPVRASRKSPGRGWSLIVCLAVWTFALAPARGSGPDTEAPPDAPSSPEPVPSSDFPAARDLAWGAAGLVSGFLAHELGHVAANWALGTSPHIHGFRAAGFIPFVVIEPGVACGSNGCVKDDGQPFSPGLPGKFAIVTAGFHVQHVSSEILLSREPHLRERHAPFRKGWLLFNIATSLMYSTAASVGVEDPRGDIANAARASGFPPAFVALFVVAPALLDGYRYWRPQKGWAPWASRAGKAGLLGLTFSF